MVIQVTGGPIYHNSKLKVLKTISINIVIFMVFQKKVEATKMTKCYIGHPLPLLRKKVKE